MRGGVERRGRVAVAVEENQTPGGVGAVGQLLGRKPRRRSCARFVRSVCRVPQPISAQAQIVEASGGRGRRSTAIFAITIFMMPSPCPVQETPPRFGVGIAAASDERGIADASGKFAAGAPCGSCGEKMPVRIERDGAHRAAFMAEVMLSGVRIFAASAPGGTFAIDHKIFRRAKRNAILGRELSRRRPRRASCARSSRGCAARVESDCVRARPRRRRLLSASRRP